jgi:hypothetical protein
MEEVFDRSWRCRCRIEQVSVSDLAEFIRSHYLGKRPAIALLSLAMLCDDEPVGCIVFSAPPREIEKRYGGTTWELSRLYLLDHVPRNAESWLISKACRWILVNRRDVQYLVSYADPSAGHRGTIYEAANWTNDGRTDEGRKTPRCDYYDARTGKKYGRRGNMPEDAIVERRPRVSKRRFVYPMNRKELAC